MTPAVVYAAVLAAAGLGQAPGDVASDTRAQKLIAAGDLEGARAILETAVRESPQDARPAYLLGTVLETRAGEYVSALAAYREAIARDAGHARAHARLGAMLSALRETTEAEQHLRAAIKADPSLAEAHFDLGLVLSGRRRFKQAVESYLQAVQLAPREPRFRLALADGLRAQGDLDGAAAELRKAAALAPRRPIAWMRLGLVLAQAQKAGSARDARHALETALRIDPNLPPAWQGIGRLELRRGRPDAAVEAFQRARRNDSRDPGIARELCDARVAIHAAHAAGAFDGALVDCLAALELSPTSGSLHLQVAELLVSQGDCQGARREVESLATLPRADAALERRGGTLLARCSTKDR
jgi:tetratricopeptide (TPR) repeat protein